ncbi:hypothetical protein O970_08250 [Candidatus Schmidhempelia bombi str. Bimp]|uniref:Uncharacterized protein n=1 Tax=Candidatus Schmidhempelia bombi str. Bimp TaxID=1387197 RepID=A0AB94IB03_9GAMM|nr:hypothetical protein O970_08250 [Candidatus Schmidhempelia bombi str. Bimp]
MKDRDVPFIHNVSIYSIKKNQLLIDLLETGQLTALFTVFMSNGFTYCSRALGYLFANVIQKQPHSFAQGHYVSIIHIIKIKKTRY